MSDDVTQIAGGIILILFGFVLLWIAWKIGWAIIKTNRQEALRIKNVNEFVNENFPFEHLGKSTQRISDVKRHLKDMEDL